MMRDLVLFFGLGLAMAQKVPPKIPDVNEDFTLTRIEMSGSPGPLTELKVTDNVMNLQRVQGYSLSSVYVQTMRQQAMREQGIERALVWNNTLAKSSGQE
jgi:hypothetical protein